MPTYSYRCTECGHAFDIQQAFTDDSLTTCPSCNGVLRKVFGAVGVTFNGSGFYRTDSRTGANGSTSSTSSTTSGTSSAPSAPSSTPSTSTGASSSSGSSPSTSGSGSSSSASKPAAS